MAKPKLTACYKVWLYDWDEAQKAAKEKSYGALLAEQANARKQARRS